MVMTTQVQASPLSDLSSPSQEVRTRAAAMIRDQHLYKATPRAPWDEFASTFEIGDSAQTIADRFHKRGLATFWTADEFAFRGIHHIPLDDSWALLLAINDSTLTEYKVVEEPKEIRVEPPAGYSGFWRTYRINGECARLDYYVNGHREIINSMRL
jgi:hypothetical protein